MDIVDHKHCVILMTDKGFAIEWWSKPTWLKFAKNMQVSVLYAEIKELQGFMCFHIAHDGKASDSVLKGIAAYAWMNPPAWIQEQTITHYHGHDW